MSDAKRFLRNSMATRLKAMHPADRLVRSARVQARLMALPEFQAARSVMAYQSDLTEVDTREIIMACLDEGRRISLPRTVKGALAMEAREIRDVRHDLDESPFGFKEPKGSCPTVAPESLDLIVAPGRAFDPTGYRLGRGGGYYDRFLSVDALRAARIAIAYDFQIVEAVPHEDHDTPVDMVVTETRTIRVHTPN